MISVIMGVYNNEKTVEKAVLSILNGTFKDLEFVIVDDGSTDSTFEVLEKLASENNRIRLLKNDSNKGLAYSLNRCLEEAKGEFIARQDADDVSAPNRLEAELEFLTSHPELSFVGTAAKLVDETGRVWGTRFFPEEVTEDVVVKYNPFIHPTMLFKAEALKKVGGYRDTKHTLRCEDYDLIFRLYGENLKGGNLNKMLLDYYESTDSFYRHTFRTRLNEAYVRRHGSVKIHRALKGFVYSFKPILLAFVSKRTYNRLHNDKWQTEEAQKEE